LRVDSERAEEPTKGHQAPYARHALVGGTWPHAARVRTSHTSSLFLEAMPLSPLAPRPITTHLLGASRASSSVFFHTPQMRTRSPSFKGLSATSERLGSASSERDGAKSRLMVSLVDEKRGREPEPGSDNPGRPAAVFAGSDALV